MLKKRDIINEWPLGVIRRSKNSNVGLLKSHPSIIALQ